MNIKQMNTVTINNRQGLGKKIYKLFIKVILAGIFNFVTKISQRNYVSYIVLRDNSVSTDCYTTPIFPISALENTNLIKAGNPRNTACIPVVKFIFRLELGL